MSDEMKSSFLVWGHALIAAMFVPSAVVWLLIYSRQVQDYEIPLWLLALVISFLAAAVSAVFALALSVVSLRSGNKMLVIIDVILCIGFVLLAAWIGAPAFILEL